VVDCQFRPSARSGEHETDHGVPHKGTGVLHHDDNRTCAKPRGARGLEGFARGSLNGPIATRCRASRYYCAPVRKFDSEGQNPGVLPRGGAARSGNCRFSCVLSWAKVREFCLYCCTAISRDVKERAGCDAFGASAGSGQASSGQAGSAPAGAIPHDRTLTRLRRRFHNYFWPGSDCPQMRAELRVARGEERERTGGQEKWLTRSYGEWVRGRKKKIDFGPENIWYGAARGRASGAGEVAAWNWRRQRPAKTRPRSWRSESRLLGLAFEVEGTPLDSPACPPS
jgi:hypothetical protein